MGVAGRTRPLGRKLAIHRETIWPWLRPVHGSLNGRRRREERTDATYSGGVAGGEFEPVGVAAPRGKSNGAKRPGRRWYEAGACAHCRRGPAQFARLRLPNGIE